jgi:hypothetical protein
MCHTHKFDFERPGLLVVAVDPDILEVAEGFLIGRMRTQQRDLAVILHGLRPEFRDSLEKLPTLRKVGLEVLQGVDFEIQLDIFHQLGCRFELFHVRRRERIFGIVRTRRSAFGSTGHWSVDVLKGGSKSNREQSAGFELVNPTPKIPGCSLIKNTSGLMIS